MTSHSPQNKCPTDKKKEISPFKITAVEKTAYFMKFVQFGQNS